MIFLFTLVCLCAALAFGKQEEYIAAYKDYRENVVTSQVPERSSLGLKHSTTIHHNGASFLTVHFSHFHLRDGDRVVVESASSSQQYEYTKRGRSQHGSPFFSSAIAGDTVFVKYYIRTPIERAADPKFGYSIDKYSHGFPSFGGRESICGHDNSKPAKCYQNQTQIYQNSKGVARLLIEGRQPCTGWLVGCDGYFLTNEHCINYQGTASNTDYEFMAESSKCDEECKESFGCQGKLVATHAKLIDSDAELDFALLQFNTSVVDLSPFHYLQVRTSEPAVLNESIYIPQYPMGWAKRLSKFLDDGSTAQVTSITKTSSCGADLVAYMADTQGGSSGSPVISSVDHQVIAIHNCGGCSNTGVQLKKIVKRLGKKFPVCKMN